MTARLGLTVDKVLPLNWLLDANTTVDKWWRTRHCWLDLFSKHLLVGLTTGQKTSKSARSYPSSIRHCFVYVKLRSPVGHVELIIIKLNVEWWHLDVPLVLDRKFQSRYHSKNNSIRMPKVENVLSKSFINFHLNKYILLIELSTNVVGIHDRLLQIVKKKKPKRRKKQRNRKLDRKWRKNMVLNESVWWGILHRTGAIHIGLGIPCW